MRIALSALLAFGVASSGALAGGGKVTSNEAGPKTLTSETTNQLLDKMSVPLALQPTPGIEYISIIHAAPPPAPVIEYAPPPSAPSAKKSSEAKKPKEIKVAAATVPLVPREVVRQCATCHGYDGLAKIPTAPNIAGSSRQYIETQLKAFRSGKRENEVMSVITAELSNAEIKAAAKWYASLKVTVEGSE